MKKPSHIIDIFLQPGDFYFGDCNTRIRTLLGSCISITLWHPKLLIGGMCHYMLPSRGNKKVAQLDGRYGDEAILMFLREAMRQESDPASFVIKVFGGGNMFDTIAGNAPCRDRPCKEVMQSCRNIACKNAVRGVSILEDLGFRIEAHDLGGRSSRNIFFDIWNGHVWVRKNNPLKDKA
jgi:chemotaxis protein CheD